MNFDSPGISIVYGFVLTAFPSSLSSGFSDRVVRGFFSVKFPPTQNVFVHLLGDMLQFERRLQ